jgi:VIT1/CCC1 family predicted Fe2+/Mn2+ transporter
MTELVYFVILVNIIPAFIGFYMAKKRGKNPFIWALLSGICAFALIILRFQFTPLDKKNDQSS